MEVYTLIRFTSRLSGGGSNPPHLKCASLRHQVSRANKAVNTKILSACSILMAVLASCQSATATPISTSTPPGQMETMVAATIYAHQTSTIAAEQAEKATLTEAVPLPSDTPEATPTPNAFHLSLPASACWMNSGVSVRTGQTVVVRASGAVNTWNGREGSNGDPNGQAGICGAIQCPLQGVGYGALIGRLEDLPTFFVGSTLRFTATQDGQLYFTVNDWKCEDYSGVFDILITFP